LLVSTSAVQVRFADPSGSHLSPAGEYNLRLGVMKELQPELIATHAGEHKS
jgi:DNA topoisomerase VI subunit B